jgi:RES domain-containing protein
MEVYRIAKTSRCKDLSGSGASLYGGRWNPKGTPVVYTSESPALAVLEVLVHMDLTAIPKDMSIATIEIPEAVGITKIADSTLPRNWRRFPPPQALADIGKKWVDKGRTLLLKVPSVLAPQAHNFLINPKHEDMGKTRVVKLQPCSFDSRLFSK